jgi:hypothetical protein
MPPRPRGRHRRARGAQLLARHDRRLLYFPSHVFSVDSEAAWDAVPPSCQVGRHRRVGRLLVLALLAAVNLVLADAQHAHGCPPTRRRIMLFDLRVERDVQRSAAPGELVPASGATRPRAGKQRGYAQPVIKSYAIAVARSPPKT